jgi:hypothetical protein
VTESSACTLRLVATTKNFCTVKDRAFLRQLYDLQLPEKDP